MRKFNYRYLKQHRESKGISIDNLSGLMKKHGHSISRETYRKIENGIVAPRIDTLIALCEVMIIPLSRLLK